MKTIRIGLVSVLGALYFASFYNRTSFSRIEQVRKGGLPPLMPNSNSPDSISPAGVNRPSLLVRFWRDAMHQAQAYTAVPASARLVVVAPTFSDATFACRNNNK